MRLKKKLIKDETGTFKVTGLPSDIDMTIGQPYQLKTFFIFLTCRSRYPFKCESIYKRRSGMNSGMYQKNRILTEESINLMHNDSQEYYGIQLLNSYGFGWMNDKLIGLELDGKHLTHYLQGHSGRGYGFGSLMFFNQDTEIGVILFINQGFNYVPQFDNIWDIFDILYKEGLVFRNISIDSSGNVSGFSIFLFSLTIVLYVIFLRYRSRKSRRE